ncbi:MAG TPA: response regulator transcription factor [Opitutaceae bacterium]|nr:response regulator transcription factor [Opitutaceae bacterium]
MNETIKIFLADNHTIVREGLKRLMEGERDFEICGEATTGTDAVGAAALLKPDVFILDMSLPDISGASIARRVKENSPQTGILVLTTHEDASYIREFLQAGATGYILQRSGLHELVEAIRSVAAGHIYIDSHVSGKLVSALIPLKGRSAHPFPDLSDRETEVLRLIAQGYSNRDIAEKLSISTKTVETYKARSMHKLGLHTRVDLVRTAVQRGWLQSESISG